MPRRFSSAVAILSSPVFLIPLALLLLNDLWLKQAFPGILTGKLSDFCGLWVFALFWMALLPRYARFICLAVVLLFTAWKSPMADTLIAGWNKLGVLPVGRVADLTDLVALVTVPAAYLLFREMKSSRNWRIHPVFPILVSAVAFSATSYRRQFDADKTYMYSCTPQELVQRINALDTGGANLPLSLHTENANYFQPLSEDTLRYHIRGYDTTYYTVREKSGKDSTYMNCIPQTDTVYVMIPGRIEFTIQPWRSPMTSGGIDCAELRATLYIRTNGTETALILRSLDFYRCRGFRKVTPSEKEQELLFRMAEQNFFQPLQHPVP